MSIPSVPTLTGGSANMNQNPNEQLIQSGFELIVKAFDEQEKCHQSTVGVLEEKISNLLHENKELKNENGLCRDEIQQLRSTNVKLQLYVDTLRNKLDNVRKSILEDGNMPNTIDINDNNVNDNLTQIQMHLKSKSNQINQKKMRNTRLTKAIPRCSTSQNIIYNNNNSNSNSNQRNIKVTSNISANSEYYVNSIPFINKEKEYSDGEGVRGNDDNKTHVRDYSGGRSSLKKQNKIKVDRNYLEQLKLNTVAFPTSTTAPNSGRGKENVNTFTSSSFETVSTFLVQCKDRVSPSTFEKMLLLFNNHKSALISSNELVSKIKELLQLEDNTYLYNLFNTLTIP